MHEITSAMRDYIKTLFIIEERGGAANTTELAKKLQVSPASVTEMVHKLVTKGMLTHEPYREIRLTEKGRETAINILRRHRLLEKLFVDFLGLSIESACEEASKLELQLSDHAVNSICVAFNHPSICPCGKPIYSDEKCCGRPLKQKLKD